MKIEENWHMGFRGEVVQRYRRTTDGRQVIIIAHPEPSAKVSLKPILFQSQIKAKRYLRDVFNRDKISSKFVAQFTYAVICIALDSKE